MSDELVELRARVEALEAMLSGDSPLDHIKAERVDIVESDGTLRLSLANGPKSADTVIEGEVLVSGRSRPGLIFFNDEGTECGGLTYYGKREEDGTSAWSGLTLDRYNHDQVVAVSYNEGPEGHSAGMQIVDRPAMSLSAAVKRARELEAMPAGPDKDKASSEFYAGGPFGQPRMYVGRTQSGDAVIQMCTADGQPRLRLSVPADGDPVIQILDRQGEVEREL